MPIAYYIISNVSPEKPERAYFKNDTEAIEQFKSKIPNIRDNSPEITWAKMYKTELIEGKEVRIILYQWKRTDTTTIIVIAIVLVVLGIIIMASMKR